MSFQNDDHVSNISSRLFPFSRPQKTQFLVIAGVAVMLKTELESRKILVSDFLLQLTILTFSNHEIHSPKILNLLASVSAKISTQHEGALSKLLPALVKVLAEAFGDLDYETSSTPTNSTTVKTTQVNTKFTDMA